MKICTKCKEEKELCNFTKNKNHKDGLEYFCKSCKKDYQESKKLKNYAEASSKTCSKCKLDKPLSEYGKCTACFLKVKPSCKKCRNLEYLEDIPRVKKYKEDNKEYLREYNKKWQSENKEYVTQLKLLYKTKNKDLINEYRRIYSKRRRLEDNNFKLTCDIRTLITSSFKRVCNGKYKKSDKTENILGCTIPEFIEHLQSLFTEDMTLENHGNCEECWHIDHKIPISSAKTEKEIYKLNHYTNLQPLWRDDNLSKGCKH